MARKLIFLGGIHGVGKSTFCQTLSAKIGFKHHIASQLIKTKKASAISKDNKNVKNIPDNQALLIDALNELSDRDIILDGHFSILDENGTPQVIGTQFFGIMRPSLLVVLTDSPEEISKKLESRDGKKTALGRIEKHQEIEIKHAELVSKELEINLIMHKAGNSNDDEISKYISMI